MIKNFYLTIWSVIVIFVLIMGSVAISAWMRPSGRCSIDPVQIAKR